MSRVQIVGLGNPYRGDDGAGIEAARALSRLVSKDVEVVEHDGEPAALIDLWDGSSITYVIDAVRSEDAPGTIDRVELDAGGEIVIPSSPRRASSHALGIGDAVELARVLGRLPDRLVLVGVTGSRFGLGDELSQPVLAALEAIVSELAREVAALEVQG